MANIGKIISARGPVIDIAFASEDKLPRLNTASIPLTTPSVGPMAIHLTASSPMC